MAKTKLRDWVGHDIELLWDITTHGGDVFPLGTVMRVYGHWRGCLQLEEVGTEKGKPCRIVRGVSPYSVRRTDGTPFRQGVTHNPPRRINLEMSLKSARSLKDLLDGQAALDSDLTVLSQKLTGLLA